MRNGTITRFYSPLRYPGGKGKLSWLFRDILRWNRLCGCHYLEPYAGGAGIAISLLLTEYVSHIHLNDISFPVYCFWKTIKYWPEFLCRSIKDIAVTPAVWKAQKNVISNAKDFSIEQVGFAFFFLNRTNHSGVLNGGMIGGQLQQGKWKIDARYNKPELIRRIENISEHRHKISVYNLDAEEFIERISLNLKEKGLVYLDPPYFKKGQDLYENYYTDNDHIEISKLVQKVIQNSWVITYDKFGMLNSLYDGRKVLNYNLDYSANKRRVGKEVIIFSDDLDIPSTLINWKNITPGLS